MISLNSPRPYDNLYFKRLTVDPTILSDAQSYWEPYLPLPTPALIRSTRIAPIPIPSLVNYLETHCIEISHYGLFSFGNNWTTHSVPLAHIDHKLANLSLVLPISNCNSSTPTNLYSFTTEHQVSAPLNASLNKIADNPILFDASKLTLHSSYILDTMYLLNISQIHRVENYTNEPTVRMVLRLATKNNIEWSEDWSVWDRLS